MAPVRGVVLQHGGLEHAEAPNGSSAEALQDVLLLRVVIRDDRQQHVEVQFRGRWAILLSTLEPEDQIAVENPSPPEAGQIEWRVHRSPDSVVQIRRGEHHATFDHMSVQEGHCPEWLKLPSTRPSRGLYQYVNYLITVRDGVELNMFAVVYENAKPGPQALGRNAENAASNILVA